MNTADDAASNEEIENLLLSARPDLAHVLKVDDYNRQTIMAMLEVAGKDLPPSQ